MVRRRVAAWRRPAANGSARRCTCHTPRRDPRQRARPYLYPRAAQVALIQCAQAMGISRYIFFSIFNCDKHPEVPLMNIKACTEDFLASSGLNYTTLRLCGFMQVRARARGRHGRGSPRQPPVARPAAARKAGSAAAVGLHAATGGRGRPPGEVCCKAALP